MLRRLTIYSFVLCAVVLASTLTPGPIRADAPAAGTIDTLAGGGTLTGEGIPATSAHFGFVYGVAVNSHGDVFASDFCSIKKISGGTMTTAVGTGVCPQYPNPIGDGGPATLAGVGARSELAFDAYDNLYISDTFDCAIRKVDAATGTITTIAGRAFYCSGDRMQGVPATSVQIGTPLGIALGPDGSVYISQTDSCIVRKVTDGIISTFAGTGLTPSGCGAFSGDGGPATSATLSEPRGLAVDSSGNVYIDDDNHCRVREVSAGTGIITTVAGTGDCYFDPDGPATSTRLDPFGGLAVDSAGDLLMADAYHCLVRKLHDGNIITVAGSLVFPFPESPETYTSICGYGGDGGPATQALLNGPVGVAADPVGNLYIADVINGRIRIVYGDTPPLLGGTNAAPTISAPGAQSAHVGDAVAFTVSANDPDGDPLVLSAAGLPGGVTFTDHGDGTGSVAGNASAPGAYHAKFWASDGTIPAAATAVDITVSPHAASLAYTGDKTKPTGSALTLSAHVTQSPDGTPGDLTKLALYFDLHGTLAGTNLSYGPIAVSASGDAAVTLPAGLDIDEYAVTVRIAANGYFAASPASALVGVYGAQTSASGTGWVLDGGAKSDFVISAKYGPSFQGQLQYTYRENGLTMKLKSDALQWLVVRGQTALLRGTASLNGVSGYVFEVTVVDNGSGPVDSLGLSVWRADGSLVHTKPPTVLGGGSITVRPR